MLLFSYLISYDNLHETSFWLVEHFIIVFKLLKLIYTLYYLIINVIQFGFSFKIKYDHLILTSYCDIHMTL